MNLKQYRDQFRIDMGDKSSPPMWSNDDIDGYANDAEDETCRRALLLVDSTSLATEYPISAGDEGIDLHPSVLYVRRARTASNGRLFPKVARAMDEEVPGWEDAAPSRPVVFVPDWQSGYLRFWPPASANDVVKLTVVRTPLRPMSDDCDSPEIPERYHRALLDWMKHLGYQKQDADTMDIAKAAQFEARFASEFGEPSSAKDEHWALEQYYDIGAN